MKVFLDRKRTHPFIRRVSKVWEKEGIIIEDKCEKADIHFCVIRKYNKKCKIPVVQRLDGIYYNLDQDIKKQNKGHSKLHKEAEGIVYQSYFSKKLCEKFLASRRTQLTEVIYNGIPENWTNFKKHDGFNIMVAAKWRRPKRLKEIIEIFLDIEKNRDIKLHILGNLIENKPVKHKKIIYYDMVEHKEMKKLYQIADCQLHLCRRDSCPNSVVEAIGSGIPVITSDDCGGATEMCNMTKGCVVCFGDPKTLSYDYPYRDSYNILSSELKNNLINSILKIYSSPYRVKLPKELEINNIGKKYINFFERVLNNV